MPGAAPPAHPVYIAVSKQGLKLSRRLQGVLPACEVHGRAGRVSGADAYFEETAAELARLFKAGHPIVAIMSAGIVIRALGPHLEDKRTEPPVVVVAEDGAAVAPLLGGHSPLLGGANAMARKLADALMVQPAITTASDVSLGVALDAPPPGWRVANREAAKPLAAALLAGEPVRLDEEACPALWLRDAGLALDMGSERVIRVTHKLCSARDRALCLHPPVLAVGVGCERNAAPDEVTALVRETLRDAGLAEAAVAGIFSINVKMDEAAVHAAAGALDVPARFFDPEIVEAETPRLANPSQIVFGEVGCHGVAEGAALAAVGAEGSLIVEKRKSRRATVAVALSSAPLTASAIGRARGRLTVIGTGPGAAGWRAPETSRAVAEADEVVGYGPYLDLLGGAAAGKPRFSSELGEEEARVRKALDRAARGKKVALVCSGDPGVYALASLVFEVMDKSDDPAWRRLEIDVQPGISAMQAAAARAGAPLGHDFCAISLSDLLTDWTVIEARLQAAAAADFVVAFYNPASKRRRWQLERAREVLLSGRPSGTPVVLARDLGRADERVTITTLGELSADQADMLTLVLVGSSDTRLIERSGRTWAYTPRGYARKMRNAGEGA